MRSIILTILFLIPLIGSASFPIKITTPSDTIIEPKKETMEEYKIRIQKQLYISDNDSYYDSRKKKNLSKWKKIHPFIRFLIIIIVLALNIFIALLIKNANNPSSFSLGDFVDDFE